MINDIVEFARIRIHDSILIVNCFNYSVFHLQLMPTVIFVNSAVSILYHCGLMQAVIQKLAVVMHYTMGTSAAETLCTASSIFLGQVPVTVALYLPVMNKHSFKTSYMKRDAFFESLNIAQRH